MGFPLRTRSPEWTQCKKYFPCKDLYRFSGLDHLVEISLRDRQLADGGVGFVPRGLQRRLKHKRNIVFQRFSLFVDKGVLVERGVKVIEIEFVDLFVEGGVGKADHP